MVVVAKIPPVEKGGGAYSYVLHALVVRPLTTRPREDGALFPQDRSPMANRSFLLCQRWLKNVFPSLSILPMSLPAFSTHLLCPSTATVLSLLFHASNISLYRLSIFPSSSMYSFLSFLYSEHSDTTWTRSSHSHPQSHLKLSSSSTTVLYLCPRSRGQCPRS